MGSFVGLADQATVPEDGAMPSDATVPNNIAANDLTDERSLLSLIHI